MHRRVMMNFTEDAGAAHTTSTSSCEDEKGAQALQWTWCEASPAASLERTPCLPACHRASSVLPGCSYLVVIF